MNTSRDSARFLVGKKQIGEILLENGVVMPSAVDEALKIQQRNGGLVGNILLSMGACSSNSLLSALLHQSPAIVSETVFNRQRAKENMRGIRVAANPARTKLLVFLADMVLLTAAFLISLTGVHYFTGHSNEVLTFIFWPTLLLFALKFQMQELYAGEPLSPVDELRRVCMSITYVYMALAAATFLFKHDGGYSRAVFITSYILSVVMVPIGRAMFRNYFSKLPGWGYPVIVLGEGDAGRMIVRKLQRQTSLGLKPVALLDDTCASHGRVSGVPIIQDLSLAPKLAKDLKIQYAIIAMPGASNERLTEVIEKYGHAFPHLLVIPDLIEFPFQNSPGRDLGGVLSLSVRQELLLPRPRMIKRTADLLLTAIGGTLILPLLAVIAVLVKFSSPGSILYTQMRMGKNGTRFKAYKFRTMYGDGEARLQELLEKNPALKAEYEVFHKLQADPRVTPIGRILRKYSLDEFPQLWNVLRGEMSLVGPRPYLEREVPKMDEKESIILKCVPGITGMWQVSARNGAPFSHRINMDVHYVRNWSVWFDAYILASTLRVVVRGTGA